MVTTHRITLSEFEAMPREGAWELIDGEPVEMTPSAGWSGWVASEISARLRNHVRAHDLGWAFAAGVGFILFDDRAIVRSPDAGFVRKERLAKPPESFVPLAPDFAVEVLSPTDRRPDALAKIAMYRQAGVRLAWLVDPAKRTVTVFHADDAISTHHEGDVLDGEDVIPGFTLSVAEIFG